MVSKLVFPCIRTMYIYVYIYTWLYVVTWHYQFSLFYATKYQQFQKGFHIYPHGDAWNQSFDFIKPKNIIETVHLSGQRTQQPNQLSTVKRYSKPNSLLRHANEHICMPATLYYSPTGFSTHPYWVHRSQYLTVWIYRQAGLCMYACMFVLVHM